MTKSILRHFLFCAFIVHHSSFITAQAQRLDKAAEQQLEINIRKQLEDFYKSTGGFAKNTSEDGAKEQLQSKLLLFGQTPKIAVYNDITPSPEQLPLEDYFAKLRGKYSPNPSSYVRELDVASLRRRAVQVVGDSATVEVFFDETLVNNQRVPISMMFSARLARDTASKYPYFTRLKINGSKRLAAPAEAVVFASATANAYQTFLDEQSLPMIIERVASGLATKLPTGALLVQVSRFSYAGCNIYDTFAREFSVTLANNLATLRPNVQFSTEGSQAQTYEIQGYYETSGDKLGVVAELYDPTGKSLGQATNADLPLKWFDANKVGFIPPDYKRTAAEQRVITQNMVSGAENLNIELSTNKGKRGLLFKAGDPMHIYVQVNRPCKVRVIYKDASDKLVLVRDMALSEGMLNRAVLVEELECTKPFGNETLIAYATTDKFASLNVQNERFKIEDQEYEQDIIKNTLEEAVKTMKAEGARGGAKKVNNGTPTFGSIQLQLQTVEK